MAASDLKRIVCVLAVLAGAPAAQAQLISDPVDEVLETMGLKSRDREPIDYRERAPLVVPPSGAKLRAPESAASGRNAQWPQDPDLLARKRRAEEARAPSTITMDRDVRADLVGPDVGRKRNAYAGVPNRSITSEGDNPARALTPDQVRGALANSSESGNRPVGGEPGRQYLTEPPKGYRRAAAGAPVKATIDPMKTGDDSVQINALRPSR